ncbi:NXPE family member 3-like [Plectropomus leopardus]|uniref:NXPE family member 3-like n=1 Tax=Plectropomus leopardus TaxID=160734 RepID=UPI001C4B422F|nr:NXPE family member 3-like [Plectropomus leopardus]
MNVRACTRREYTAIFLILALAALIFVIRYMEVVEFPHEVNTNIITQNASTVPDMHYRICTSQSLSPEEALEERSLLDSVAWPEMPLLPDPLLLLQTSDPAHSTFTILPRRGGGQWRVGDQLEVMIKISDFQGRPKKFGGDFLLARLHNLKLGAGVAGQVVDHLNGSYSAVFSLLWEGEAYVQVMMVHPTEAIPVLNRVSREHPDRVYFLGYFGSGSDTEITACNVCLRSTERPVCNFTDLRTGEPWFCFKPKNLSCDARTGQARKGILPHLKANEAKLFRGGVNLKVNIKASGPANVTVLQKDEGQPEVKSSIVTPGPSGYYYQGLWQALDGTTVQPFRILKRTQCLKGKNVHLYGDSTMLQFFTFLITVLPGVKKFGPPSTLQRPFIGFDFANNILVTFSFHGPPMLGRGPIPPTDQHYVANDMDSFTGGDNTVVVFGIWAHLTPFPIEVYIRRLRSIRKAVVRLLTRAPGTMIIIRTGNPRELSLDLALGFSDWYSLRRVKVLRAMFKGLNVHFIDAWEMVLAHSKPHAIHPSPAIIMNMIDVLLSHVCPKIGS